MAVEHVESALKGFDLDIQPEVMRVPPDRSPGSIAMLLTYTAETDELRQLLGGLRTLKKEL